MVLLQASEGEIYTVSELLGDVANCKSEVVHLIVDQSFAGSIHTYATNIVIKTVSH